jgi:hypothetical protein
MPCTHGEIRKQAIHNGEKVKMIEGFALNTGEKLL